MPWFFAPMAAWLFLLIGPLVLFYFLKLRRQRVVIPSLVLWQQVLQDNRVNSPFQKFKRNLLLLLQLLLLILLVLAAMQPYMRGSTESAERLPVLIDASASMAALDKPGGITRLEAAKAQVEDMIDGLLPNQQLSIISFSNRARKLTPFTNNKRVLREALDSIETEDVPSQLEEVLRMSQALSRSHSFQKVLLISDGNLPAQVDFNLPFSIEYQIITPAGRNAGITNMSATRAGADGWDVFVSLEGTPSHQISGTVELIQDGVPVGAEPLSLEPGQIERLVFPVTATGAINLAARFVPDGFDSLQNDNEAFLSLEPPRSVWVYVPEDLIAYRLALESMAHIRIFPEPGEPLTEDNFDLVISNTRQDLERSAPVRLFDGVIPPDIEDYVDRDDEGTTAIDWDRTAPILQHVQLSELLLYDNPRWIGEAREAELELFGYEVLAYGRLGPLLLRRREALSLSYFLLFRTEQSTLVYRLGFPIMVSNLVQIARERAGLGEVDAPRTGTLPQLVMRPNQMYEVSGPQGMNVSAESDDIGRLNGIPASHSGEYVIEGGGGGQRLGVALLSPAETSLEAVDEIQFDGELGVIAASSPLQLDHSFWPVLAALALIVLLVEWWLFQRRPGGYGPRS